MATQIKGKQIADSTITNDNISSSAAIAQSKLNLDITNSEVNASAAIDQSKLNLSITNSEVNASAAIDHTKLAISAGTGVAISAAGQFSIGQAVATTDNVQFADLTLSGNLTVSGTTTTINTAQIDLEDNVIKINSGQTGTPATSLRSGLEVERGTDTNVFLQFNENTDAWEFSMYDSSTSSWNFVKLIAMEQFNAGAGLSFDNAGEYSISAGGVGTTELAANAVQASKIDSNAVVADKIKLQKVGANGVATPAAASRTITFSNRASTQSNGIPDAEKCFVFLNGVLLESIPTGGTIGTDGDFQLSDNGNDKEIEIDHDLLSDSSDRIIIQYVAAS